VFVKWLFLVSLVVFSFTDDLLIIHNIAYGSLPQECADACVSFRIMWLVLLLMSWCVVRLLRGCNR